MGQYLAIGLASTYAFRKADAERTFKTVSKAKEAVQSTLAPLSAYTVSENETSVFYNLKPHLLETELLDFLRDFFALRFKESSSTECEKILSALQELHTAKEIMDLAQMKRYEQFQFDEFWEPDYMDGNGWNSLKVLVNGIDLSLDGKVIMECYGTLFSFFTSLIAERLQKYQLASSIRVKISG